MKCIYCKSVSDTSKGLAHIVPEALIKNDSVLPRGTVCDSCNNYLGQLDNTLILHNHIWPILQLLGFPGKRNTVRRKLGYMEREGSVSPWKMVFDQNNLNKLVFDSQGVRAEIKDPPGFNDLRFRRALHHIAFKFLALRTSLEFILDNKFDAVRSYIRKPAIGEKWPYLQIISLPNEIKSVISVNEVIEAPGKTILLQIFSDLFYVDLLNSGEIINWARSVLINQNILEQV